MNEPDLKLSWKVEILPDSKEILKDKSWSDSNYEKQTQYWVDDARVKSEAYQKYIFFIIDNGHITPSSHSIFNAYINENKDNLTIEEIAQALNDLWPTTDEDSKDFLLYNARRLGIKESSSKLSWQVQEPSSFEDLVGYLIHYGSPFPHSYYPNEYGVITSVVTSDDPKHKDTILLWGFWAGSAEDALYYYEHPQKLVESRLPSFWPVPLTDFDKIKVIKEVTTSSLKLSWQTFNIYEGKYREGPGFDYIVTKDGKPFSHVTSLAIENHSPTGFAWGYGGSGPSQLALAILYDHTNDAEFAKKWRWAFKDDYTSKWPSNRDWQLSGDEIDNWINEKTIQKESWVIRRTLSKGEIRDLITSVGLTPINFYMGKRTRRVDAGYLVNDKWENIPGEMIEKLKSELSALTPEGRIEQSRYKGKSIIVKVPVYRDTPNLPWREVKKQLKALGFDRIDVKTGTTEIRVDVWGIADLHPTHRREMVREITTILRQFNPNFKAYETNLPGYFTFITPIKIQEYPDEVTSSLEKESWAMTKNMSKQRLREIINEVGLTALNLYIGRRQRKAFVGYRPNNRWENIPPETVQLLKDRLEQEAPDTEVQFPITSPYFQYLGPRVSEKAKKFLVIFVSIKRDRQLLPVKEVKDAIKEKFPQYEVRLFTRTNEIEISIDTPWNIEGRSENLRGPTKEARCQELLNILKQFNTNTIISPSNNWRRNESGYHFLIPFSPYQEYVTGE